LLEFALMTNGMSINAFLKTKESLSKTSFICYYNKSGLLAYKKQGAFDSSIAKLILTKYFEKTIQNTKERMVAAYESIHYLTDNEECSLVQMCMVLGSMGYGLTWDDLHTFADELTNQNVDECQRISISKHVTEGMLLHHKDLVKVLAAASRDPKRACQATVDTRDAMFSKLTSYIELLNGMGVIPWKTYCDIPSNSIYNMDELGNETTKHRNKVIQKKKKNGANEADTTRTFMRTAEGDGRMPWHITVCLTTRADGKLFVKWLIVFFWGGGSESIVDNTI